METFCRNEIPANHLYYAIYAITCLFICSFQFQHNLLTVLYFKVGLSPSKQNCFVCFKESPLKMMNNTFYFTLKVLSVVKIFKFFSWLFWSYRKSSLIRKARLISTFWRHSLFKKTITIHILSNISWNKGSQTMKFGQLIEYNKRYIFLQKSCRKWGRETSSIPVFVF